MCNVEIACDIALVVNKYHVNSRTGSLGHCLKLPPLPAAIIEKETDSSAHQLFSFKIFLNKKYPVSRKEYRLVSQSK